MCSRTTARRCFLVAAFDNIAYPLKLMGVPKAERARRVEKLVAHLGVKIDLTLYPY